MLDNNESVLIVVIIFLALVLLLRYLCGPLPCNDGDDAEKNTEQFTTRQQLPEFCNVSGVDPDADPHLKTVPRRKSNDYESLIYDNTTGAIMSGSQFMENTGIIAPPWIPPAWDPDAFGPSSKGKLDPVDYEDDPRMLYNKCSLSCCSAQYPTPFQSDVDPFVCSKKGQKKYLASDYVCQNNTGGVGCLCMTPKQVHGMQTGHVDYYDDNNDKY